MKRNTRHIHLKLEQLSEASARRYFKWMQAKKYSPQTQRAAFAALKELLLVLAADSKVLADATSDDLDTHHLALKDRGLAPSTVFQHMASIRTFFNWLESEGELFANPAKGMILPKPPRSIKYVPSEDDVRRLLAAPKTHTRGGLRDRAFMELLYSTGARLVEIASISIFDVDLRRGSTRLQGKGRKQRTVPLGKKAVRWLEDYIRMRHSLLKGNPDIEALWLNTRGGPLSYQGAEKIVHRNAVAAGLRPFSAHALRRACATHMLKNGAHPVQLQMLLGHASMKYLGQYLDVAITELKKTHEHSKPGR
jgi:integrase/recombinase XerD